MMLAVLSGAGLGLGLLLLAVALFPPQPTLAASLARFDAAARLPRRPQPPTLMARECTGSWCATQGARWRQRS